MIIGVDRSGRENDLPLVYAAVRGKTKTLLKELKDKFPTRELLKSKHMRKEELLEAYNLYKGDKGIWVVSSQDYLDFRRKNPNMPKWKQKFARFGYFEAIIRIVQDGDRVLLCPDFIEEDMKGLICDYLERRLRNKVSDVRVRVGDKSCEEIQVADIIAGAVRKNKLYKSRVRSH
jgi:hypothetical protein